MRSAKTKQSTHYQPQNQQIANHTSKQTIRQSSNQNYGQFHTVKRGSRYWYFTWFSGQVLFANRTAKQCKTNSNQFFGFSTVFLSAGNRLDQQLKNLEGGRPTPMVSWQQNVYCLPLRFAREASRRLAIIHACQVLRTVVSLTTNEEICR